MKLEGVVRAELGKSASRRLRQSGQFPAVIYGSEFPPVSIALIHSDVINQIDKFSFHISIILAIGSENIKVRLKDIQHHPFKPKIEHMDFIRI
ncbi:50S ribosomal protein L25 [Candidatus Photodesmus katoptron]|uniref:Large ribosomal subunit protein bL25 n=1 Tax=Candidatus Photodesmus katoptron Akat1 TaxID=1236703 RepID=S3DJC8_9GAMM|nr:50S ribosomal protein L25 [Candidatus Photodesmus katoptron]EPE37780.1 ribosomal L25p [Candidatus Photodesmus katoptron Akat1]KEY90499.1 50S ribosomal protein L25 [Candidatus Photodesmus katoptron]